MIAENRENTPGSRQVEILIIGQGICGTFLGWRLQEAGISFLILDEQNPHTASRTAAGIINPVTGRRIVKTWMIAELLPFVREAYRQIGQGLDIDCISQKILIDFFSAPQMRNAFLSRYEEDRQFLRRPADENGWFGYFNYDFGYGEIHPCYLIDIPLLLKSFRQKCLVANTLLEERFNLADLVINEKSIAYKNILAKKIIFCDGVESFQNPFFKNLPFAPNKGEALIIETEKLPADYIYKKSFTLVPVGENLYWMGSSFEWNFESDQPTGAFRRKAENALKEWLKFPYRVLDHMASVRPATLERRPFVGFHPAYPQVGILNGMGTKGCSLAPYFAGQLTNYIAGQSPLLPQADIHRFAKTLNRNLLL